MRLSSEQIELQDLVRRFLSGRVTSEYLRTRIASEVRSDAGLRQAVRDLGMYESFAGTEPPCGMVELALLAEECGRALMPDSCVEHVLMNSFLESLLSPVERRLFSSFEKAGDAGCALAFPSCCEFGMDQGLETVSGRAIWALCGDTASLFIGFAQTDAGLRGFLVELPGPTEPSAGIAGSVCTRTPVSSLDVTTPLTEYSLTKTPCTILSVESTENLAVAIEVLKASEVSGLCQRVIEMTSEYVKTRKQFGVSIGSFQAIQQKLAQIYAESEALMSLSRFAAWSYSAAPDQRKLTSRAAALKAAELGVQVCEVAIQCHGGIGFTWEYDLHLFLRRAQSMHAAFGISEARASELIEAAQ